MKMNILLLLLLSLFSCDERTKFGIAPEAMKEKYALDMAMSTEAANDYSFGENDQSTVILPSPIEKQLIKNGSMRLKVDDVKIAKEKIDKICKSFGAYTASENQDNLEDRLEYIQSIRVPAQYFDSMIMALEKIAEKVDGKNLSTEDVTAEFIDITTRLNTKKELENRYREILKQAKTVSDILAIESQIASVRAEIESMEGRLNYYKDQVAYSTLDLNYYEILGTDFGFASKLVTALGNGWDNLLSFLIGLTSIWPFVLIFGVGGYYFWRRYRLRASTQQKTEG